VFGSLEHAVQLLVGRGFPLLGDGRQPALFALRLESEPSVDPLLGERDAKLLALLLASLRRARDAAVSSSPLRSLRNDGPDGPFSVKFVSEFPMCHDERGMRKAQTGVSDDARR